MKVPFNDLTVSTAAIKEEYLRRVEQLLQRGHFILGEEVALFEKQWADFVGTAYSVGVSNGADALYLGLVALGVGVGDEVITQGNAYNASVTAILRAGAVPRFADIDPETLSMDVGNVGPLINGKTKAIMPVHLYGGPVDMGAIAAVAKKYHLAIIEDCAQAHGAQVAGKIVGSWGEIGAFSFYPTKNLGAFGDAGAVTTNSGPLAERIAALRNLGQVAKNDHQYFGTNMRLDPLQAIALSLKLPHLPQVIQQRTALAARYDQLLATTGFPVQPVERVKDSTSVYHLYVVTALKINRDELQRQLTQRGVETAIHYPTPVYRQPFYRGPHDSCPITDQTTKQILSLPFFVGMTEEQQDYVVDSLRDIISSSTTNG